MSKLGAHWSKTTEAGSLLGIKTLLLVYRFLGRRGFRAVLYPVMCYYYLTRAEARSASNQYLEKIKPFLSKEEELSSFQHFMAFGELLLDKILVWTGQIGRDDVVFESRKLLDKIDNQSNQSGGVIIVSHLGNTDVCNAIANQLLNIHMTILVYTHHTNKYNSLFKQNKEHPRVEVLEVNELSPATAMILSERIERGEYIIISGDRTPVANQGRVSEVSFFGDIAPMPQGAFILASLLKCPVYLLFCLKQGARYHIYMELFKENLVTSRDQRNLLITKTVQEYAYRLEYFCKKTPLQWFNFFHFWRESP